MTSSVGRSCLQSPSFLDSIGWCVTLDSLSSRRSRPSILCHKPFHNSVWYCRHGQWHQLVRTKNLGGGDSSPSVPCTSLVHWPPFYSSQILTRHQCFCTSSVPCMFRYARKSHLHWLDMLTPLFAPYLPRLHLPALVAIDALRQPRFAHACVPAVSMRSVLA